MVRCCKELHIKCGSFISRADVTLYICINDRITCNRFRCTALATFKLKCIFTFNDMPRAKTSYILTYIKYVLNRIPTECYYTSLRSLHSRSRGRYTMTSSLLSFNEAHVGCYATVILVFVLKANRDKGKLRLCAILNRNNG